MDKSSNQDFDLSVLGAPISTKKENYDRRIFTDAFDRSFDSEFRRAISGEFNNPHEIVMQAVREEAFPIVDGYVHGLSALRRDLSLVRRYLEAQADSGLINQEYTLLTAMNTEPLNGMVLPWAEYFGLQAIEDLALCLYFLSVKTDFGLEIEVIEDEVTGEVHHKEIDTIWEEFLLCLLSAQTNVILAGICRDGAGGNLSAIFEKQVRRLVSSRNRVAVKARYVEADNVKAEFIQYASMRSDNLNVSALAREFVSSFPDKCYGIGWADPARVLSDALRKWRKVIKA